MTTTTEILSDFDDEYHKLEDDYHNCVRKYKKLLPKYNALEKRGDHEEAAKVDREIIFWMNGASDLDIEMVLLEEEHDAVAVGDTIESLFDSAKSDSSSALSDDERDEESMEDLVANLFGDDKEADTHD